MSFQRILDFVSSILGRGSSNMGEIKSYTITEPWLKIDGKLGEAPYWDSATNTFRYVDIIKQEVYLIDLNKGPESVKTHKLDISIGTTAEIEGNPENFVFAGKHGYGICNKQTGKWQYIKKAWNSEEEKDGKPKRMRFNDGAVDKKGRYWAGAMNDPMVTEITDEGFLFRLDPDGSLHRMLDHVSIPNGISWSPDDKLMYFTDSPSGDICVYDFDAEKGTMSNKRVFYHCDIPGGVPDGHCWDEEGFMWVAFHGTGKVRRISREGKVVAEISLPTRCVTCPGFAGEDLYITSAEDEDPSSFPGGAAYMGSLFKIHVGVKGCKLNKFRWEAGDKI